jgi:hypothetical protein
LLGGYARSARQGAVSRAPLGDLHEPFSLGGIKGTLEVDEAMKQVRRRSAGGFDMADGNMDA